MGNSLGGKKSAKIMKIDGETIKFKTPIKVGDVIKDYPGHVVLDSKAVRHYGIRAKPLDPFFNLEPKKLYFLVELPKFPQDHQRTPRRVRSAIQMSAKDRLESLMLAKRSVSDLSIMGHATRIEVDESHNSSKEGELGTAGGLRVKMRLPKAEVEKLMSQSRNREEVAEKIMNMYSSTTKIGQDLKGKEVVHENNFFDHSSLVRTKGGYNSYKKRVGFLPIHEGEIGLAVATS